MFISNEEIERKAEEFLGQYHSSRMIPVPIEKIVEIDLQISIVPIRGLLKQESIDAFLSHDFKELYIDYDHYMEQTNRSRFTLAHEMGHLSLHKKIIEEITSIKQWKKFVLGEGTILSQNAWLSVLRTLGTNPWFGGRLLLSHADKAFDEAGTLTDEKAKMQLKQFMDGFVEFVKLHKNSS